MLINRESIVVDRKVGSTLMQLMSEGEITLAEGKADIGTLLKCNAELIPNECRVGDNRVSFDGVLKIKGMYLSGGEGKSVHGFTYDMPVSDFVNIEGAAEGMTPYMSCTSTVHSCTPINERKLKYKVITDVDMCVREQAECSYVSSIEDVPLNHQRFKRINAEQSVLHHRDIFTVRDSLTLPMGKPNIGEVIESDLKVSSVDYRCGDGSVRISGDLNLSLIYKGEGESNPMELYEGTIPFRGEIEAEGVTGDMLCDVTLMLKENSVNISADEDGEMRVADVDAAIEVNTEARENVDAQVLEDVYIINKSARLCEKTVVCSVCAAKNISQCPVKEVVTLDDKAPDMLQIYRTEGKPYIDYTEISDGKIEVEGAVAADILYVTGNDDMPVYCFKGMVPFKHTAQANGAKSGMDCTVTAQLEHIGFNMLSGREVEVRCVINIHAMAEDTREISLVDDVVIEDIDKAYLNSLASITLYVVRKGDTLWKLAKKFNTTVEDIAAVNDIENPDLIYPRQRLIIVKRVA